ncbi:uncharacterized protein EI97DRAFT_479682 [Westerdykella ornata]|uniref:Altered inheritance of mitochondria protein 24, mitochondrial n=1 Tax=Westerdykella ornata TaxID=318751 RepID=A0A6A6JCN8_WESOR|nr:uncharacterized protein EI97DRAFT_479682 [Westerdykella ornata]KAF2273984.1 hypothetical protein EI97DRAFT_479682 [Westerdykella ornata]
MLRPAASCLRTCCLRALAPAVRPARRALVVPVRCINITAIAPPISEPTLDRPATIETPPGPIPSPDARFEVIGSPFSLLSASLSASQQLYTRRGTLVGLSGKGENTLSTLSFLEPFRRAPVGIPFLYQKVTSTSPITALISTKSPISSIVTVHLDGRQDWLIAQRQALLAWTGLTLVLKPQYNFKLGMANWGNTHVTGRGLLALTGTGQIYQVRLKAGESYVAHPSNVVAYTASASPPLPFRFKSSSLVFQVPDLGFGSLLQNIKFFRVMSETPTWRTLATVAHTVKTWLRRSIWGDRLFVRFEGPTTLLLQSRGSRVSDVLTLKDVDEIAASPPGALQDTISRKIREDIREIEASHAAGPKTPIASQEAGDGSKVRYATVHNGKVDFEKP